MTSVSKVRRLQIGEKLIDAKGGATSALSVLWQQLAENSDALNARKLDKSQNLASVSAAKWTGIAVRVAADTWTGRTLQAGSGISLTDADGIAGDPSIICTVPCLVSFFFTAPPTTSQVLCLYVAAEAFTIPANMVGTKVKVGTNATATFAIDVQKNGSTIATISISTLGVATLTTVSGTAKSIAVGDVLKFVAPAVVDATIANVAVTVKATRS